MISHHNRIRGRRHAKTRATEVALHKLHLKHPPARPGWSVAKKAVVP